MSYHYVKSHEIGPATTERTASAVMGMLQSQPNAFFPFHIKGSESIQLGSVYELQNVRVPNLTGQAPGADLRNYVVVSEVGPTTFSFATLPGHFDGAHGVITFTTYERDGFIYLQQNGDAPEASWFNSLAVPVGVWLPWRIQAENLATAAQFPETLTAGKDFIEHQVFGAVTVDLSDAGSVMVIGPMTSGSDASTLPHPPPLVDVSDAGSVMVIGPITTDSGGSMLPVSDQ
jgi:hypothetical protein